MKKIFICLVFILITSCDKRDIRAFDLSGDWNIHHIIINDKDILINHVDNKNMFNQTFNRVKQMHINNKCDSLYLLIDRNSKPIEAGVSIRQINNDQWIDIFSPTNKLINGKYRVKIDTLKVKFSELKAFEYRVVLTSTSKKIFMNRIEITNKKDNWLNKMN